MSGKADYEDCLRVPLAMLSGHPDQQNHSHPWWFSIVAFMRQDHFPTAPSQRQTSDVTRSDTFGLSVSPRMYWTSTTSPSTSALQFFSI